MTDADYDYILDEIECREKIDFERNVSVNSYVIKFLSEVYTLQNNRTSSLQAISILGHWIFDSKYKKALFFTQNSFNIICSPSIVKEQVATF